MRKFSIKSLAATVAILFSTFNLLVAQAPQAISYQAAARNLSGSLVINKTIGLRFSVRDATSNGTVVYKETQNVTTNAVGMFLVNIGQGTVVSGTFSSVNWGSGNKYVQVEYDSTATGSSYMDLGTQQLMSMPYALNSGNGNPAGSIIAFGGTTAPSGFLFCNGAAISRTAYANLFAAIGTAFGSGDGSTTFNLPDLRGIFLRGLDGTAGTDPDASSRIGSGPGGTGNTGNAVGSLQLDALQGHNHTILSAKNSNSQLYLDFSGTGSGNYTAVTSNKSATVGSPAQAQDLVSDGSNGSPRIKKETRPINIAVNYIIKF